MRSEILIGMFEKHLTLLDTDGLLMAYFRTLETVLRVLKFNLDNWLFISLAAFLIQIFVFS